jgi:hypothetical protein
MARDPPAGEVTGGVASRVRRSLRLGGVTFSARLSIELPYAAM